MKVKLLCFVAFAVLVFCVNAKFLDIKRIEVDIDPKYLKVFSRLEKADNIHVYMATVYRENDYHYELVYKSELVSGCTHEEIKDPILQFIFKESTKYGNVTEACPLKVGHYVLRGFKIDSDDLPTQLPQGAYRFDFSCFIKMSDFMHEIYTDKYYYNN
ncbi:hypothetical protein PVAND_015279 [Polypedilum vanderplanki]|uniref:Uncharacterized protein n=1 Tax=Polypedilum vanderplanki TaxID=319348 RepID=A0A9J6BC57_POLVA|nr:hypothetical protein PVAND_015279 [Polypedilum vanderplanki]